jgi:hypothetical protein
LFKHELIELPNIPTVENDKGRWYKSEAGLLPSITTVLGYSIEKDLESWRNWIGHEAADSIFKRAGVQGTKLHAQCEAFLRNEEVKFETPFQKMLFNSIKSILEKNITKVIGIELPLYSNTLKIAGRCDLICNWNDFTVLVDFKNSRKKKKLEHIINYHMQAAGYCYMFEERTGIPLDKFIIIVAVEQEPPQLFYGYREDYIKKLQSVIDFYYKENT